MAGRPSSYKPEYCDLLVEHMAKGYSFEAFGGVVRAGRKTIYDWTHAHPEFAEARELGSAMSQLHWEKMGMQGLRTAYFNATVWIFNMKNRFGWNDKRHHVVDQTIEDKTPKVDIQELKRLINKDPFVVIDGKKEDAS